MKKKRPSANTPPPTTVIKIGSNMPEGQQKLLNEVMLSGSPKPVEKMIKKRKASQSKAKARRGSAVMKKQKKNEDGSSHRSDSNNEVEVVQNRDYNTLGKSA